MLMSLFNSTKLVSPCAPMLPRFQRAATEQMRTRDNVLSCFAGKTKAFQSPS